MVGQRAAAPLGQGVRQRRVAGQARGDAGQGQQGEAGVLQAIAAAQLAAVGRVRMRGLVVQLHGSGRRHGLMAWQRCR
ncbi:conserved hypothetical protein [Xanthomonas phaseoli pv. phaseoli]|nr:conserved hypothetical protein [Xanthomonas phaseoli pv. phaseoli]